MNSKTLFALYSNKLKASAVFFILVTLIACQATPYQANTWDSLSGGYRDKALAGENRYQVSFSGNGQLKANVAYDYALLRSAELCLEKGFRYFKMLKTDTEISQVDVGTGQLGAAKIYSYKPYVWMNIQLLTQAEALDLIGKSKYHGVYLASKVIRRVSEKYNIKLLK